MVLQSFNHPNVVKLFGVCLKPNLICLVMEYCAMGSLYHVINKADTTILWDQFFSICKQSVLGLQALHNHNPKILHRDLKSLNLLMTKDWNVKVADFGLSLETNARTDMLIETRGTTSYMPPELFHAIKYSTKSDVYSLGIVFFLGNVISRHKPKISPSVRRIQLFGSKFRYFNCYRCCER